MKGKRTESRDVSTRIKSPSKITISPALKNAPLCALISLSLLTTNQVTADDNQKLEITIGALIGAHNTALPPSLLVIPGVSDGAELITYGTNIALKYIKAPLTTPGDVFVMPNSADQCSYTFTLPQTEANYTNLLGIWDTDPLPTDWGILGAPQVAHANTDVKVGVYSLEYGVLDPDDRENDRLDRRIDRQIGSQQVTLPVGRTSVQWEADTQVSILFDYALPVAAYGITNLIYGKAAANLADNSTAQAIKQARSQLKVSETLFNIGVELGLTASDSASDLGTRTNTHAGPEHQQAITVFDVLDPVISTSNETFEIEATDFGGALYSRNENLLRNTITASDPCGRKYSLSNDADVLLPLGTNTLTWTLSDLGPKDQFGGVNTVTLEQTLIVKDTQAPIMVPPAGKVIEVASTGVDVEDIMLGFPRVVDLADSQPGVTSDAPNFFPVNSRTEVLWEVSDESGNTSSANQWITVKEIGSNSTPVSEDRMASTLTSEPVDIQLLGSDPDFLDGRFDPLEFKITEQPGNGEFVAPLFPYFIEDYRTQPEGPLGEEFLLASPRTKYLFDNYCQKSLEIPTDWVYRPEFIQVTDAGEQFITDRYWICQPSSAQTNRRVSKWDKDGNFLGQKQISDRTLPQFVLDDTGRVYLTTSNGAGSSTALFLQPCPTDFGTSNTSCETSYKFNYSSADGLNPQTLVYARVDNALGVVYVTDKRNVYAFDIRGTIEDIEFLGALMPEPFLRSCSASGSSAAGFTIEIDSESNLYIADSCNDRIHKFEASVFTNSGEFVAGDHVGWLGKCDTSTNKSCDETKQRSKGYSCTDQTCSVADTDGEAQGQFSVPLHLALDPNDILYVADYANQRIQRFSPDGSFAGEAVSTGTGINMGDEPGFILGNFDSPKTVSVNSTQFYIVDQAESFVHVFETSPLKEITDESAVVTYVSDFDFHSSSDSFKYTVTDGLATSEESIVTVNVARNFRPPVAVPNELDTLEDKDLAITLAGDDPDGVIGSGDFNALDSLSYRIVTPPLHGELVGGGNLFEYRPNDDFYGVDNFEYVANDGVFDSEPGLVVINVEGVNDAPRIMMPQIDDVAIGFPVSLAVNFYDDSIDPELDIQHQIVLDWGDGTTEFNSEDIEQGALVVSPVVESMPGVITASHVYTSTGSATIRLCLTDSLGSQSCETESISRVEQASLAMEVRPSTEELTTGEEVSYEVELFNLEPSISGSGLVAEEVTVSHLVPQGLELVSVSAPEVSCSEVGSEVSCDLGSLDPGESRTMQVFARNDGSEIFDSEAEFTVAAMTSTPSTREFFLGYALTTLNADTTDSDNDGMFDTFETKYNLLTDSDDSLLDSDMDGLSNIAEFLARTSPESSDTDGDGLDDAWEVEFDLNPLLALDANADTDGDGFSNLQEYLADRNPLADERSGDRLVPILSGFENSTLFVPAAKVGNEFFDLEFELVRAEPYVFELTSFSQRNIRVEVPDASEFVSPENVLEISAVDVAGDNYLVDLQLITAEPPFEFQVTRVEAATVTP